MTDPRSVFEAYLDRHKLVSGGSVQANWTPDGKAFWFAHGAPENTDILCVDLQTGKTSSLFDVSKVREALTALVDHELPHRGLPFDKFTTAADGVITFDYNGSRWQLEPRSGVIRKLLNLDLMLEAYGPTSETQRFTPKNWKRVDYVIDKIDVPEVLSPSREWFASIRNNNVAIRSTRGLTELQLTFDGTHEHFWDIEALRLKGTGTWAAQYVWGGVCPWSPDSLTLFCYRRDIRGVFQMPRVDWMKPFEEVDYSPYQKAGAKIDRIEAFFIDVRSRERVVIDIGDVEDRFIQLLGWTAGGNEAWIISYSRDFKSVDIFLANRETGQSRKIFSEAAPTFIRIQHLPVFSGEHGLRLLPEDAGFLWLSTRDGWNHLYRYDSEGSLIGQLTSGDWPIYEIVHVGSGFVYFTAAIDTQRPYDVHVCRVPLAGGPVEQLTRDPGIHTPTFAPEGQAFLDSHSSVDRPTRTDLIRADGHRIRSVSEMDISPLRRVGYVPPEEFTVKAADGVTDLWGVLYKPFNFDPNRSYPVVEYIYGGPQSLDAVQRFFAVSSVRYRNMPWALAQLGYIVVTVDGRGTPGRSKAFHDVVYGNWTACIPDHAATINQLCDRHSWMDRTRVGITGHSWGGYFSTCALVEAADTYHAAVSSAPGYDAWDLFIYEPYLGLPKEGRAPYDAADITKKVGQIKGKLMIAVGSADNVTIGPAMRMTRALIDAGISHEFVVIPQGVHWFAGAEEDYFFKKLTGWFEQHVMNRNAV